MNEYKFHRNTENLQGRVFGLLTAIRPVGREKRGHTIWECRCQCGEYVRRSSRELKKGPQGQRTSPKSCGCTRRGILSALSRTEGELSRKKWHSIRHGAKRRHLPFEIDITYAWNLFLAQNKQCALTGLKIVLDPFSMTAGANTASLDRIDSAKGYVVGNVQWVHATVNIMRREIPLDEFIGLCCQVAQYRTVVPIVKKATEKNCLEKSIN